MISCSFGREISIVIFSHGDLRTSIKWYFKIRNKNMTYRRLCNRSMNVSIIPAMDMPREYAYENKGGHAGDRSSFYFSTKEAENNVAREGRARQFRREMNFRENFPVLRWYILFDEMILTRYYTICHKWYPTVIGSPFETWTLIFRNVVKFPV